MKTIKFLFLLSFSILLFSCDKDNSESNNFNINSLKGTKWSGTLDEYHYVDGNVNYRAEVGFIFLTEDNGDYSCKYEGEKNTEKGHFTYSVDGNFLFIDGAYYLSGYWSVIQADKKNMKLEKGTGGKYADKYTLILTRKD